MLTSKTYAQEESRNFWAETFPVCWVPFICPGDLLSTLCPALCPGSGLSGTHLQVPCPLASNWVQPTGCIGRTWEAGRGVRSGYFFLSIPYTKGTATLQPASLWFFEFWQKSPLAYLCLGNVVVQSSELALVVSLNFAGSGQIKSTLLKLSSNYSNWVCHLCGWQSLPRATKIVWCQHRDRQTAQTK